MTKRFEIMVGGMVWDNHVDEDRQLSRDEVVDLLNELNDENTMLKHEIEDFQTLLADKENELLKPIIRQIEEAYESERTQIGRNVLRQLLEAIQ